MSESGMSEFEATALAYTLWRSEVGEPPRRMASVMVNPHMFTDAAFPARPMIIKELFDQVSEHLRTTGHWQMSEERVSEMGLTPQA